MGNTTNAQTESLTEKILHLLPQTQCTQCGYVSCRSYAEAIANQDADINHCPTGGQKGIQRLADLLYVDAPTLNTTYGTETPRSSAIIDETACIGCTICIRMCPTDAIIGAKGMLHTVAQDFCTGCGLCVPRCPLDAITLENVSGHLTGWDAWSAEQAEAARFRYEHKLTRLLGTSENTLPSPLEYNPADHLPASRKSDIVRKAIERARQRLSKYGIKMKHG